MKTIFNPGTKKKTLTLVDNVVYSTVKDLNGDPLELKLSVLLQNGNSEMRAAMGEDDPKEDHSPKPALVWVPGGGWKGTDKNMMLGEMTEFANAGYVVASIYYRSSAQGHYPGSVDRCGKRQSVFCVLMRRSSRSIRRRSVSLAVPQVHICQQQLP